MKAPFCDFPSTTTSMNRSTSRRGSLGRSEEGALVGEQQGQQQQQCEQEVRRHITAIWILDRFPNVSWSTNSIPCTASAGGRRRRSSTRTTTIARTPPKRNSTVRLAVSTLLLVSPSGVLLLMLLFLCCCGSLGSSEAFVLSSTTVSLQQRQGSIVRCNLWKTTTTTTTPATTTSDAPFFPSSSLSNGIEYNSILYKKNGSFNNNNNQKQINIYNGNDDTRESNNGNVDVDPVGGYKKESKRQQHQPIPFIIETLPEYYKVNPKVFAEISTMCIDAFFHDGPDASSSRSSNRNNRSNRGTTIGSTTTNENALKRSITPWKEFQLRQLRSMQQNDLLRRRLREKDGNIMFVARQVVPVVEDDENDENYTTQTNNNNKHHYRSRPLLLDSDLAAVYNPTPNMLRLRGDYVRGDVIGFVEVTKQYYATSGLGTVSTSSGSSSTATGTTTNNKDIVGQRIRREQPIILAQQQQSMVASIRQERPVLTNLSVQYKARQSGVGSRLLEICEQVVQSKWGLNEIILEVEDDNELGLRFYEKRGYMVLYEDPCCRRYDVSGFFIQQKRCKRRIMRKVFMSNTNGSIGDAVTAATAVANRASGIFTAGMKQLFMMNMNSDSSSNSMSNNRIQSSDQFMDVDKGQSRNDSSLGIRSIVRKLQQVMSSSTSL